MDERIDIYNVNQKIIGSAFRKVAHRKGLWHKTFHCWIVSKINNHDCLIFQLRSAKSAFPNLLDISTAGHFKKGETKKRIVREINEELGLSLRYKDLYSLGQRFETIDYEKIKNREIQDVFLVKIQNVLSQISPNLKEVAGLFWIPLDLSIDFFSGKINLIEIEGIIYNPIHKKWENIKQKTAIKKFVPRLVNYYLTISIMSERLVNNILPLSI